MKLVIIVFTMIIFSPTYAIASIELIDVGRLDVRDEEGGPGELVISLDSLDGGVLPKNIYHTNFSVLVEKEVFIESGAEIQFETKERKLGFFVLGNLKLEKGVYLHSVNNKGEEPKWLGLQVMPTGRLEADDLRIEGVPDEQPVWMLIYGTAVIRNSEVSRVRVSADPMSGSLGNLTLEKCIVNGLSINEEARVKSSNSFLKLSHPESIPDPVHVAIFALKNQADFSQNNKWEGGAPVFWVADVNVNGVITDINDLERRGIKLKPPTAVENMSWGVIKKIFSH